IRCRRQRGSSHPPSAGRSLRSKCSKYTRTPSAPLGSIVRVSMTLGGNDGQESPDANAFGVAGSRPFFTPTLPRDRLRRKPRRSMSRGFCARVAAILLALAPAIGVATFPRGAEGADVATTHVVTKGQTLEQIAKKYGIPIKALVSANK